MPENYQKEALDYYKVDVGMYNNKKVRLFRSEFAREKRIEVYGILLLLLDKIYGTKGYYLLWDDDERAIFCDDYGLEVSYMQRIVDAAVLRGLFDKPKYDEFKVLTSKEIQNRFFSIANRRKNPSINKRVLIMSTTCEFNSDDVDDIDQDVGNIEENVDSLDHSTVQNSTVQDRTLDARDDLDIRWEEDGIEQRTWRTFEAEYNTLIPHPHDQMNAVNQLVAEARARGDPDIILPNMIAMLKRLKDEDRDKRGFWRKQPFLPSTLVSLWAQVWEAAKQEAGNEIDEEELDNERVF